MCALLSPVSQVGPGGGGGCGGLTTLSPAAHIETAAQGVVWEVLDPDEGAHDGDDTRATQECGPARPDPRRTYKGAITSSEAGEEAEQLVCANVCVHQPDHHGLVGQRMQRPGSVIQLEIGHPDIAVFHCIAHARMVRRLVDASVIRGVPLKTWVFPALTDPHQQLQL